MIRRSRRGSPRARYATNGTLEELLIDCAATSYPTLLANAQKLVATVPADHPSLDPDDLEEISKPAGKSKAIVAAIGAVLKPGKAIQVSIQDQRWITDATVVLERIKAVDEFIGALLRSFAS